ncbi:Est1 DNA/RNA binding domain-containing protein [Elsinoe ampelina]|uniref:Est1 DNA/RNA binding domain-containing protein n=1 Tax=Elsinoe ampelina TaxID=302913 RepID=A0A6A6G9P5_9PEZI|nr:Est1 DNA/RNA binding domain-containing protein [Elsinoe ampelina]
MTTVEARHYIRAINSIDAEVREAVKSPANADQHPQIFQRLLRQYRTTVEELCGKDVLINQANSTHTLLWTAHNLINAFCRKGLAKLRSDPAKPVETRKFIKGYLEFLKDSRKWYRTFINLLTKTYGWMPGLEQITGDTSHVTPHPNPAAYQHSAALCYHALISLGDLCRWRAAERLDKEPTWAHAVGYYDLAAALNPANGAAFHQRAFVEMSQKDHFRAIYYFYRSIVVEERYPNAINNLATEMKSLRKKWGSDELSLKTNSKDGNGKRKALVMWYIRLQSLCYSGEEIPGHAELEATVISHIEGVTKVPDSAGLIQKVILANMAAERTTLHRLEDAQADESEAIIAAYNNYHNLNLKTLILLLRIFEKEIEVATAAGRRSGVGKQHSLEDKITPTMHNVLPALRLYQHNLLSNYQFTRPDESGSPGSLIAAQLWNTLAGACSAAATAFPVAQLMEAPYMLEEDVEVTAFSPAISDATRTVWHGDDGSAKRRFNDRGVQRLSTTLEMLARIRDLQVAALHLSVLEDTPIRFDKGQFSTDAADPSPNQANTAEAQTQSVTMAKPPPKAAMSNTPGQHNRRSTPSLDQKLHQAGPDINGGPSHRARARQLQSPVQMSATRPPALNDNLEDSDELDCQDLQASRMVDDLVGPDDSPVTMSRPVSGLDIRPQQRTPSVPSSFAPTPPTNRIGSRVDRLQNGSLFGQQGQNYSPGMHSPLLYGNGGPWDPAMNARSKSIGTPPNGQAR